MNKRTLSTALFLCGTVIFLLTACLTTPAEPDAAPVVAETTKKDESVHSLILSGYTQDAKGLLASDTSRLTLNAQDTEGRTPLHCAAQVNDREMAQFLVSMGANTALRNAIGETPLHTAIANDSKDVAQVLFRQPDTLFAENAAGVTAMETAFSTNDPFYRDIIITRDNGAVTSPDGKTLVHYFAEWNDEKSLALAIQKDLPLSTQDNNGKTPLAICYENSLKATKASDQLLSIQLARQLLLANAMPLRGQFSYFEDSVKTRNASLRSNDGQTPLHMAAIQGHTGVVSYLITQHALIGAKDISGATPLHEAVRYGHTDIAKLLIENGAQVNAQDALGKTPLLIITPQAKRAEMYGLLLKSGADTRAKDMYGDTCLHLATLTNMSTEILRLFVSNNADINERNKKGVTPLSLAVEHQYSEHIAYYASLKADINAEDIFGNTPLTLALENGLECTKTLVTRENVMTRDSFGNTPLHIALQQNASAEQVAYLLVQGADVNARNRNGDTPLYLAVNKNHRTLGEILLLHGADVFSTNTENYSPLRLALTKGGEVQEWILSSDVIASTDGTGNTPLHYACEWKLDNSVKALLERGANVNVQNANGETPLFFAVKSDSPSTILLLIEKGANLDLRDFLGNTALHASVRHNSQNAAAMLILNGSDVNAQNMSGKTPLHEAAKSSRVAMVTLLLNNGADINATDATGKTVLIDSISSGNAELISMLISRGASVSIQEMYGRNAYHEAVESGNLAMITIIRDAGGSPLSRDVQGNTPYSLSLGQREEVIRAVLGNDKDMCDSDGNNPLHIAVLSRANVSTVTKLLGYEFPVNRRNSEGKTPLTLAINTNQEALSKVLIEAGADPFITDNSGECALSIVLKNQNTQLLNTIVQKNATKKDISGDTILHYAARTSSADTIQRLLSMGLDRSVRNISGETAYDTAVRWQRPQDILERLK